MFKERFNRPMEQLYIHVTCATDSKNVKAVFTAVKDIVLQFHLKDTGFM